MTRGTPAGHADERTMLVAFLDMYRETIVMKIDGLDEEQARWRPTQEAASLLNLVVHLAGVEQRWTQQVILGRELDRDRESEFGDLSLTVEEAVAAYRAAWEQTNDVVHECLLDDSCKGEAGFSVRWVLLHLLEETARHAGHADITRELIDGSVGF